MTIEIPTISADLIAQVETAHIEASAATEAAVAAIREKFAVYVKHNGFIRIARHQTYQNGGVPLEDREWFLGLEGSHVYEDEGIRLRGLLAGNNFRQSNDTEFTGANTGQRLYLTERGKWIEITRAGRWSQWQGSPQWWTCGPDLDDSGEMGGGNIRTMTDAEVAAEWDFEEVLKTLGASMTEMSKKLPDRFCRLKQRAALAQNVLTALK